MKRNGKNIITDQDITLTGTGFSGQTLDETLTDHEERLDQIEGNVKWIYRNGRVGTGSGGGSGSGSGSGTWRAIITRQDTGEVLKDGVAMNLPSAGKYTFSVQVYKGGSDTFTVQYSYQNKKGAQTTSDTLNTNNSFFALKTLDLDTNGTLTIKIYNRSEPDEAPLTLSIPYITSSYSFSLSYVYADTLTPFTLNSDHTIFISDVKTRGIKAALEYSVAVGIQTASYTYTDWEGQTRTVTEGDDAIKEKSAGVIYLDLCSDILAYLSNDDNAKYRQFLLDIDLVLEGKIEKENIPQLSLKDNLIPSNLFLRVTASGGTIYDTQQQMYPEAGQFIVGTVVFQVTPFYGAIVVGRTYNFSVFLDDVQLGEDEGIRVDTLSDQTLQAVPIPVATAMEHKVTFSIVEPRSGKSYTVDYWFTAREATSSFTYYPRRSTASGTIDVTPETTDVYRKLQIAQNIEGLTELSNIQVSSVATQPQVFNFQSEKKPQYENLDQMICLGIQYVRTNDTSQPIAKFSIANGPQGDIYIYQNKVIISTDTYETGTITGDQAEIYLPMSKTLSDSNFSDYHLITIYKRLEKKEGSNAWRGIYIYIDGVLEASFTAFTSLHNKYESVSFYPGNYYINLIESSSFSHSGQDAYESFLYDIDIQGYYYAYRELILGLPLDEATKQLYDNFKTFTADEDNFIMTDQTAIYNIARYSEAPVLIMNFTDQGNGINGIRGAGKDCFKEYMSTAYTENEEPERASITLEYSPGLQEPAVIQKNSIPASFSIEPQGSSTKSYRCKNWEMYAPVANDEDHVCIYTPNFSDSNTNTFLPEESFTLKADIVDSSHTNNNAVGAFVNDVCTPFQAALNAQKKDNGERSKYASYIKNCLTGFPVLVFLHTNYRSDESETELSVHNYYFLGIYNFNLGRKSYFNLGYKNTAALEDLNLQDGFGIYELPKSKNTILTDVMVAEVQGNNEYFDFSQYNTSILFKKEEGKDETYMWGDFVNGSNSEAITRTAIANFVKKVSKAGGFIFDSIGKNFSTSAADNYGYTDGYSAVDRVTGEPKNQVPNYRAQAQRTVVGAENFYDFSVSSEDATVNDLRDFVITNEEDETKEKGIDYASLCEYYTICMAFGMVDSVEKNLNIKSWTNGKEFYLAFYDMDTCLGVSNSGSKISYFAFSDYWDWANSIEGGNFVSTKIYRDFAPVGGGSSEIGADSFFDVPSSYLFAIAKYAYFVLLANSTSSEQVSPIASHPNNLWALWRRTGGRLENAKSFIDRYYRNHLATIPEVAFNYNYRYKYFVRSTGNGFDTINFPKFYGRKIAYTETWLDNRLHILDAYFNINSINDLLTSRIMAPMVTDSEAVDTNNQDIYVLHDVFSTNTVGSQYANVQSNVSAKAKSFAPLIIKTPNVTSRYMFPKDETQECGFSVKTSGNQTVLFGGSALWTELSSINPFITGTGSFTINSDYLSVISGTGGAPCSSWTFNTPSLKSLSLTNTDLKTTLYSGNITFEGVETYPNLRSVRVDGTSINLTITNSNITNISALGMKSGSRLRVTNTPNIADIRVSGNVGDLNLPGWGNDIRIPYDSSSINSGTITVQNTKYPGASITICNAPNLNTLVLAGFSKIVVYGCPKLTEIKINDVDDHANFGLRTIDVSMPAKSNTAEENIENFTIGAVENEVDLSSWETLENVRLMNLYTVENVKLPDHDVNLLPNAFSGCEDLMYISGEGKRIILSSDTDSYGLSGDSNTFYNAYEFTMRKSEDGGMVDLYVSPNNTNLNGTFWINANLRRGRLDYDAAVYFLQTSCRDAQRVKSCSNLFRNQLVTYDRNTFAREYCQGTCSLSLSNLSGCTDIRNIFRGCPVDALNRYMFTGLDIKSMSIPVTEDSWYSVSRGDNIEYVLDDGGMPLMQNRVIYTTTDFMQDFIEDIESLTLVDSSQSVRLCFVNPMASGNYQVLETLNVGDVFNPGGISPKRLVELEYVEFFEGHKLNMQNVFTSSWGVAAPSSSGLRIAYFMYYGTYRYFASPTTLNGLFHDIKLSSATFCLRDMSYPGYVDMETFINWDGLRTCSNLFFSSSGAFSLGFNKQCSYTGFHNIWHSILSNFDFSRAGSSGGIGSVFQDLNIIEPNDIPVFTLVDPVEDANLTSTTATNISYLFSGICHRRTLGGTKIGLNITSDFLKPLPNITIAKYAFQNTKWANPIPFNFFRKQEEPVSKSVWVERGGTRVEATLTDFNYRKELIDITGCFSGMTLEENISYDPDAAYNTGVTRKSLVDGEDNEYTEYYLTETTDVVTPLIDYGYTDCFGFICGNPSASVMFGEDEWTNPVKSASSINNGVFVAPDVFYGVADGGVIDDCFSVSSVARKTPVMSGAIPKHLVSTLSTTTSLSGIFNNLNIWPMKFAEYNDPSESGLKQTYYYFVPTDFTSRANLSRTFNFKLLIPDKRVTIGPGEYERPHYFVFLNDSVPAGLSSLDSSLPTGSDIKRTWSGTSETEGSYFSIMGSPVYDGSENFIDMETGIDYEKFFNLKFDNIILPGLAAIMSGDFIKGGQGAILWNKQNHLSSEGNYAIILGINGLSTNAMLELPLRNNNFLSSTANSEVSISSVYNWAELEATIDEETGRPKYYPGIAFVE